MLGKPSVDSIPSSRPVLNMSSLCSLCWSRLRMYSLAFDTSGTLKPPLPGRLLSCCRFFGISARCVNIGKRENPNPVNKPSSYARGRVETNTETHKQTLKTFHIHQSQDTISRINIAYQRDRDHLLLPCAENYLNL